MTLNSRIQNVVMIHAGLGYAFIKFFSDLFISCYPTCKTQSSLFPTDGRKSIWIVKRWSLKLLIYQASQVLLQPLRSYQINNFWQKTMGCLCFSFYSKTNLSPVCTQTLAAWDCVHSRVYEDVRLYWQWRLFGLRLQRLSGWYSCYIVHSCNDYCLFAAQSFCCSIGWRHGNALWLEVLT